MPKHIIRLLQILGSLSLIALVLYKSDLFSAEGRDKLTDTLINADIAWLFASVLIGVVVNMSSALKWAMLARVRGLYVGYWRFFSFYLIGQFYNLILPTSVGGDFVRSWELGKHTGNQADSLASVFVERYTGVLVLLIVSGLAVLSQLSIFSVYFVLSSLLIFTLGLGFIAWMIFDPRLYLFCKQLLTSKLIFTQIVFAKLDKLLAAVQVYGNHKVALIWAFINSFVFYFLAVLNVYITARVFHLDVGFVDMLIATPIIMLIMNIPISLGNWGLMEGAYLGVFQLLGYSPILGLSVALLMRLKSLLDGAAGGILHPLLGRGKIVAGTYQ